MKKTLLLLIITLISNKIHSQTHRLNNVVFGSYKAEMLYDENGKNTSYKEYTFNSTTNEWEDELYGLQYFYNADGLIDYTIFEESTFHHKSEYTYNSDNKITELVGLDQNGSNWDLLYTDVYNYDNLNNNIEIIRNWQNPTIWSVNYRYIHTFDSNNNLILKEKQEWNTNTSSWGNTIKKNEFTYNNDNKVLSEIEYNNGQSGVLEEYRKFEYIYDTNGNRDEFIKSIYNSTTNSWELSERVTYTYDNNYSLSDLFIPNWSTGILDIGYSEDYNHMITAKGYYEWDNTQNQWNYYGDAIFNWSDVLSLNDFRISNINVYPNPATEQLNFELLTKIHKIKIFDIQGKLLIEKKNTNSINVMELNNGMYFYQINNKMVGKFIKK